VVVISSIDDRRKGLALGAHAYGVKPIDAGWLLRTLDAVTRRGRSVRVLTVEDEEATRFIIRQMLSDRHHEVIEAATGGDGLTRAKDLSPDVILLDLRLTDMTGFDVFERLRCDPSTSQVPVVVITSRRLTDDDRRRLAGAETVISKSALTRDMLRTAIARAVDEKIA
jgi:CheY-like chemotaxis protein